MELKTGFKNPKRNEGGFLTLDFLFAITIAIGFSLVFFSVACTLSLVEIAQYVAYSSSRAYSGAHETPAMQNDLGQKKFNEIMGRAAFKTFLTGSWIVVGPPQFGNFTSDYPQPSQDDNDIFVGVRLPIDLKLLHMRVPFMGSTAEDAGVGKAVLNSYLMREVSTTECREGFNRQRYAKIKGLSNNGGGAYSGAPGQKEKLITDNGC